MCKRSTSPNGTHNQAGRRQDRAADRIWIQPGLPGIHYAPAMVRRHGYGDAHTWPLVSNGKTATGFEPMIRVHAAHAWHWNMLELRTGNTWPCLVLDIDRKHGYEHLCGRICDGVLPAPNWSRERIANGHVHAVYCLAKPVHRGTGARAKPLRAFARVSEYFTAAAGADAGYNGVLAHNPVVDNDTFRTIWGARQPYSLDRLRSFLPRGWRLPKQPRTEAGRNVCLFLGASTWAGLLGNDGTPVLEGYLLAANAALNFPLGLAELRGIARSVEKLRDRQRSRGWHRDDFRRRQSRRGQQSGRRRRSRTAERDRAIIDRYAAGASQRTIAEEQNMSVSGVRRVLERAGAARPEQARPAAAQARAESILDMHRRGVSQRKIAAAHGVSRGTVQHVLRKAAGASPGDRINPRIKARAEPTQDSTGQRPDSDGNVRVSESRDSGPASVAPAGRGGREGGPGGGRPNPAAADPELAALQRTANRRRPQVAVSLD